MKVKKSKNCISFYKIARPNGHGFCKRSRFSRLLTSQIVNLTKTKIIKRQGQAQRSFLV